MAGFRIADQGWPTFQGIVQGFCGTAAVGGFNSALDEPVMQGIERGLVLLHTQLQASVDAQRFALLFDRVQLADARQRCQCHGTRIGLIELLLKRDTLHVDETPVPQLDPGSGKTKRAYLWACRSNDLGEGPRIIIFDYRGWRSGEHARQFPGTWQGHLMVDDYGGYKALFAAAHQDPCIELGCWAHARRKFFDLHQPIHQGLQRHPCASDPFRQSGASRNDSVTGGDLLEAVEREMIQVFTDQHPNQQNRVGHAAVDDGGRNRRSRDGFTVAASILRTDVAVDKELGRFDIQLFGDVFADTSTSSAQVLTKSLPHRPHWQDSGSWRCSMRGKCAGKG